MFWFIFIASIYLTILVLVSVFRPRADPAERRVALVIGNEAYESIKPLTKPMKDAAAVAGALKRLGFEVVNEHNLHNLNGEKMRGMLKDFEAKARGAAWALVYYSGHGMGWNEKNWLIPIDAKVDQAADLPGQAVSVERVLKRISGARKLRIVILDACRANEIRTRIMNEGIIGVTRGLAAMKPGYGDIVFFAARHGTEAYEGPDKDRRSFFTAALLEHMEKEGLELGLFFRKVTSDVIEATKDDKERWKPQEPFVYGHIPDEDFYFKPPRRSH